MIERDPQRLEWIDERSPEVLTVIGDATLDVNLRESGILKAQGLLSCLSTDSDNVFVWWLGYGSSPEPEFPRRPICSGRLRGLY